MEYLKQKMPDISQFIANYLKKLDESYGDLNRWGKDVFYRLNQFCQGGKMLRGALVFLASEMWKTPFNQQMRHNALHLAGAMELFQAMFLIQDDFMDRDETRRGQPAIFRQYREMGAEQGLSNPQHFGDALAVCCSDVVLFSAYQLLALVQTSPDIHRKMLELINSEYTQVSLAQMEDVYLGNSNRSYEESDILNIYLYKTARYTFSLPLMLGAYNASRNDEEIRKLAELGEYLGIIFQAKDDELGIFGDEKELGKPLGSDIMENKKTVYHFHLMRLADDKDKKRLEKSFGNPNLSDKDMDFIRELVQKLGIDSLIRKRSEKLADSAREIVENLELSNEGRDVLMQVIDYSLERSY